jgi:hypothetical protein
MNMWVHKGRHHEGTLHVNNTPTAAAAAAAVCVANGDDVA